jgi:hypothetical protein
MENKNQEMRFSAGSADERDGEQKPVVLNIKNLLGTVVIINNSETTVEGFKEQIIPIILNALQSVQGLSLESQ